MTRMNRLQKTRLSEGLTQMQLAEKSSVNLATLQKLESGVNNIKEAKGSTLLKLSIALNISIEDLIKD